MSLRPTLVITSALLVLCCGVYPAVVTASARLLFPAEASGSLIVVGGQTRGSRLIGQTFAKPEEHPEYFWGRPSAAAVDSASGIVGSSGSNYGPRSETLKEEVAGRVAALRTTGVTEAIPVDLVTKSGSGVDPHISPAAAAIQVPRVAAARKRSPEEIQQLVRRHTEGPTLGVLGDPRVSVLELNLDLDRLGASSP